MDYSKPPRFLRILACLFDLALIYLIVFLCIIGPIILIVKDVVVNSVVSMGSIAFGICLSLLSLIMVFLYLWVPLVVFKGQSIGMKVFGIKLISTNHETITSFKMLRYVLTLQACFIFSLGFCLLADLIAINKSDNGTTFSDNLNFLKMVSLVKEEN